MKKILAIMALVAFTFATQAGEGCGKCPGNKDGCDKAKTEGKCPAGEKKANDKKA